MGVGFEDCYFEVKKKRLRTNWGTLKDKKKIRLMNFCILRRRVLARKRNVKMP